MFSRFLQEFKVNATFGPPSKNTSHEDFRILPNGIYKATFAFSDHKESPKNTASFAIFVKARAHNKSLDVDKYV